MKTNNKLIVIAFAALALIGCANETVGTPQQRLQARRQNQATSAAVGSFAGALVEEYTGARRERRGYYGHGYGYGAYPVVPVVPFFY